jgi:hypothetical protein
MYQITSTQWITLYAGSVEAQVTGTVEFPDGTPVPWADVCLMWENPEDPEWPFELCTQSYENGFFAFYEMEVGSYMLEARPPWDFRMNWVPSDPISFTLASPDDTFSAGTLVLKPADRPKRLKGTVMYKSGAPVDDAWVVAQNEATGDIAKTPTDAQGFYDLGLAKGLWRVWVEPRVWGTEDWYFPPEWEAWVEFELPPGEPEVIEPFDLEVIAYDQGDFFKVQGRVEKPGGAAPPEDSTWVHFCNDVDGCFGAPVGPDGNFIIWALPGFYNVWIDIDPVVAPGLLPPPNNGDIEIEVFENPQILQDPFKLVARKPAKVSGQVYDAATKQGVAGVTIEAWTEEGDWAATKTNANGYYSLTLSVGYWYGGPQLTGTLASEYIVMPPQLRHGWLGAEGAQDQNFALRQLDAKIRGKVVSIETRKIITDVDAVVWAEVCGERGCFGRHVDVYEGTFSVKVVGGFTYTVGIDADGYMPGPSLPRELPVGVGETVTTVLPVLEAGTEIYGRLLDQDLNPVAIEAEVYAFTPASAYGGPTGVLYEQFDFMWTEKPTYTLDVPTPNATTGPVTWTTRLWVDPSTGYVADPSHPRYQVSIPPDETRVPQVLYVRKLDTLITGHVMRPDGEPAPHIWVFAEGVLSLGSGVTRTVYFEAKTDASGVYSMYVLPGDYAVAAYVPPGKPWFPPQPKPWSSNVDNPVDLQFRARAVGDTVSGALIFADPVSGTRVVDVFGWGEDGSTSYVTGTAAYTLPITPDTTWHIWAVHEDLDNDAFYESEEVIVSGPRVGVDLTLRRSAYELPDEVCESFDAARNKRILLPAYGDMFEPIVDIQAGALPVDGEVTVCAKPKRALPDGRGLIGFAYDLRAWDAQGNLINQNFNKSVRLQFYFPETVDVENLEGVRYYSTVKQDWIALDDPFIDAGDYYATGKIRHFTSFGLMSVTAEESAGLDLSPGYEAIAEPGGVLTFTHTLTNTGTLTDAFDMTFSTAWGNPATQTPVTVAQNMTKVVDVRMTVPADASSGEVHTVTVTATSQLDPSVSDIAVDTVRVVVPVEAGVILAPDFEEDASAGDVLTFTHMLTNTGTITDAFDMTLSTGWGSLVTSTPITVAQSIMERVHIRVAVPADAVSGTVHTVTVTATSRLDPSVSDIAVDTMMVMATDKLSRVYLPLVLRN